MGFIMRDLAKNKAFLLLGVFMWLVSTSAVATEVKQAQLSLQGNHYVLSADIDYQLSDKAKEALENGVPLFWGLRIKVLQQRQTLWAKTVVDRTIRYRIQYHALLNMYRVMIIQPTLANSEAHSEHDSNSYNFSTLSAALDLMATVRNIAIIDVSAIKPDKHYFMQIKANFDRDALPLPLQPIAYTNPQWYLSSDWTTWSLLPVANTQGKP
jgi:hypothetical protein